MRMAPLRGIKRERVAHPPKAADAGMRQAVDTAELPVRTTAEDTAAGAIIGCVIDWETGCGPGAVAGMAAMAKGAPTHFAIKAMWDAVKGSQQTNAQLKQDLAACNK